jgi:hypothetical protein
LAPPIQVGGSDFVIFLGSLFMKIAIIGLGSLVSAPGSLRDHLVSRQGFSEADDKFEQTGPKLPLEFSRISQDCHLTLVIDETNGEMVPTRVALSTRLALSDALTDLWIRETHFAGERSYAEQRIHDGRVGYTDLTGKDASINLPKANLHRDHQDRKEPQKRLELGNPL